MKNPRMRPRTIRSLWLIGAGALLCSALVAALHLGFLEWPQREPRFHDDFNRQSYSPAEKGGWEAFGGTWQILDGTMQNVSDDRGAKLVNGDPHWRNYTAEADIQLLSETGDAGFVMRTSSEEVGVDAYHGYFAGLRDLDDTLIIGRADFGWHEMATVAVHSHIHTRTWYHLKVMVQGCVVAASAVTPEGEHAVAAVHDPECVQQGRFGLQSYSTGAIWRNVDLRPASDSDLLAMLDGRKPFVLGPPNIDAAGHPVDAAITNLAGYQRLFAPMQRELRDNHANLDATPIADLRLFAPNAAPHVTVHGVVTMISPILFIQDSSGGIAIPFARAVVPVQIGDAVEAGGDAELHNFSSVLRNATVRLLWSHTQVPPIAVTPSQAVTGAFDAQLIETEGRLTSIGRSGEKSITFQFDAGNQSFLAIEDNQNNPDSIHRFKPGSLLRVRGICVTDRTFTGNQVPFAVLMRSAGDIQMLEPPPWWNTKHIVELAFGILTLSICFPVVYATVKRSEMRAVMDERERLAMEMHDTLAQSFAGLGFQLEALCQEAPPGSSLQSQLESSLDLIRFGHIQARRNIAAMRPGNFEKLGMPKALEQAARSIVQGGRIAVAISLRGEPRPLPLPVSDTLFRICQEAVANAVRHGRPNRISMRMIYGKNFVKLTVQDNGKGFTVNRENPGFGIAGMRQRAERVSARLHIRSSSCHGTVVAVRVRLPHALFSTWWSFVRQSRLVAES